ncbi:MAG: HAD family hydrolase [Bacteroidia bacterium]|nr:HAD family hydrolase [Bacteroidia bacterium]
MIQPPARTPDRTLYISDLDGTLLQPDATLSEQARSLLTELLESGTQFTIATARSIVSVRHILRGLPIRLPVICANGAYLSDLETGRHRAVQALAPELAQEVFGCIGAHGLLGFLSAYDGEADYLYFGRELNEPMTWYVEDRFRQGDDRPRQVEDFSEAFGQQLISFNLIDRLAPLQALEHDLNIRFSGRLQMYYYENWYNPEWFWLSIFDHQATKAGGIGVLLAETGLAPADVTVFGDSLNDESMFRMAGRRVAVANAKPEIKALADEVIGSNETDSVIEYLAKATGRAWTETPRRSAP